MKNKKKNIKPIIIVLPNNKSGSSLIKGRLFNKLKNLKKIKFKIFTIKKFPLLKGFTYYFLKKYDSVHYYSSLINNYDKISFNNRKYA